jgi:Bacterial Ig domain
MKAIDRRGRRQQVLGISVAARLAILGFLAVSVLCVVAAGATGSVRGPVSGVSPVGVVRSIPSGDVGVRSPLGLVYLRGEGSFVVAGSAFGGRTRLVRFNPYGDKLGVLRVRALSRRSTLAVDPFGGRLGAYGGGGFRVLPTPRARPRVGGRALLPVPGLLDVRGATADRGTRTSYLLDAGARAIVRVRGGERPGVARFSLRSLGERTLRGLAFNPADRLLYVLSPSDDRLFALDGGGRLRKVYGVRALGLGDPQAMVFAPSADNTDAPGVEHLYVLDAGRAGVGGRIVEATLAPAVSPLAVSAFPTVNGTWVKTIDTSLYSPSSPDPAGIVYVAASDRFLISDSEVDEMPLYQGSNIYTATRSGSGTGTGTTLPWSHEPTGLGYDPATATLYISDDDLHKLFIDRPGADGRHGTADDLVSNFSVSAFGSMDSEDDVYDVTSGHLFIADGVGLEVYDVDPVNGVFGDGNDVVTHWDVGLYGARDAEGIGIDEQSGHLLVVDPSTKSLYELTKSGALVRIIDCHGVPTTNRAYADVTMAPTSDPNDPPGRLDYWIVDRQVDNGGDPNENDGKLYEVTAPPSGAPPTVSVTAPVEGARVTGTTTIRATAASDAGVTQVAFSVDGSAVGTDTNGADGWSVSWNTSNVPDGSHTVTATATDSNGQTGTDTNGVTVDTHPPSRLRVRGPRKTARPRVTYRLSARDAVTPARKLRFLCALDSRRLRACKARYVARLRRGRHVLRVAARDEVGNTSATVAVRLRRR